MDRVVSVVSKQHSGGGRGGCAGRGGPAPGGDAVRGGGGRRAGLRADPRSAPAGPEQRGADDRGCAGGRGLCGGRGAGIRAVCAL